MKVSGGVVLVFLVTAASVGAETLCKDSLHFTEEGVVAQWTTCNGDLLQRFATPDDGLMHVTLRVNGEASGLNWRRTADPAATASYSAVTAFGALELLRRYERIGDRSVVHAISIRNASAEPLSFGLRLRIGSAPRAGEAPLRSLADLAYDFTQAHVAMPSNDWQAAAEGSTSRRFAVTSRHRTLVIESEQPFTTLTPGEWELAWQGQALGPGEARTFRQALSALPTDTATLHQAGYGGLMYAGLWPPLASLSRGVEKILTALSTIAWGPAIAIVLFAVVIRVITLPITSWSARRQRNFAEAEQRMRPRIAEVKANYTGAEQSERILAIYRENGVSPLSGLKGSVGLFVQIPFLLAVFNVTTYSAIFAGQSFLWISDLSQADALAALPVVIPLLGAKVNALPIALGVVNVLSLRSQQAGRAASSGITSIVITVLIVLLFYSFAAAVVLYWLTVNLLQAGERLVLRSRKDSRTDKQDEYQAV